MRNRIAIIGGGPAGLVALKSALDDGLEATLFEQSPDIGGQWNTDSAYSGIWEGLQTNSSRQLTVFSDYPNDKDSSLFLSAPEVLEYLKKYAAHFGLYTYIRLNCRIDHIDRQEDGHYLIDYLANDTDKRSEVFSHLILATGRFNKAHIPNLSQLHRFKGQVLHSSGYKNRTAFSGRKVLVIGNRVSGLEIASDLAVDPSITVVSSCRKPKYILTQLVDGQPYDHLLFTRYRSLAAKAFPPDVLGLQFKEFVLKAVGNPAEFGGLPPSEDILEAGVTISQQYLHHVREGRIIPKGAITGIMDKAVFFEDGAGMEVDCIIFATGYQLHLPFLSTRILSLVNTGDQHLDLFKYTFHPDLPNMAFAGLYMQIGPKLPAFELQARWITGCWSGHIDLPACTQMDKWIGEFRRTRGTRGLPLAQELILLFARAAGVEPDPRAYPDLAGTLIFGALVPSQFRLSGHGKMSNGMALFIAAQGGNVQTISDLDPDQVKELRHLARHLGPDTILHELLREI